MYAQFQRSSDKAKALRKKGGLWLSKARKAAGLTQKQLADAVGIEYYTFISQIETGFARIPPEIGRAHV